MAILVTARIPTMRRRPRLRARGFEALLAPMLRFEPVPFQDDEDARYGAVIVTSANALRAIAHSRQPAARSCRCLRSGSIPRRRPAMPALPR